VALGAVIRTHPDASFGAVQARAIEKLQQYFKPFPGGGPHGEGWPFGRTIYLSEVYALLEQVEGVDYIQNRHIDNDPPRTILSNPFGQVIAQASADKEGEMSWRRPPEEAARPWAG